MIVPIGNVLYERTPIIEMIKGFVKPRKIVDKKENIIPIQDIAIVR
ncbi:MAG: hypothetical protein ACFFAS_00900 [Promethearchaeota archaeon]